MVKFIIYNFTYSINNKTNYKIMKTKRDVELDIRLKELNELIKILKIELKKKEGSNIYIYTDTGQDVNMKGN